MSSAVKSGAPSVCVVGCGHWGKNLIRNFFELGALYGFCDSDPARLESFRKQFPDARGYISLEEVLADRSLQAVALASPAEQHHGMGMAALRAGKDVFVEKPLALNPKDGVEMAEAARDFRRVLMVGHLLRYHPAIRKIQELQSRDVFGRIEYIYSNRLSMGKIRREENALWSFAPHDISVILALMGEQPVQATATGGAYVQPNIADVTVSNMLFANGTRAHVFVSWLHPYKEQRLVVLGSKQMVVFEDSRPDHKLMLWDKHIEWKNGIIDASKPEGTPVEFSPEEPLGLECKHFLECVAERREPLTPGEEGVRVLHVLQACQKSLQMNGEPVQVGTPAARNIERM
jgi:UDP-2-acetamido-3-amino-2,3-dideoxy-glucuronate N-acetyltransferase